MVRVFLLLLDLGVEFQHIPESHGVPLVCDMSSSVLSHSLDISKVPNSFVDG